MGVKLKIMLPVVFLVFFLLAFSVFAMTSTPVGLFTATPNTLIVNWTNGSDISVEGFNEWCYSGNITITNTLANPSITVVVNNSTGGPTVYVYNDDEGFSNETTINFGESETISLKLVIPSLSVGNYSGPLTLYSLTTPSDWLDLNANLTVPRDLSDIIFQIEIPKINIGSNQVATTGFYINNTLDNYTFEIQQIDNIALLQHGSNNMIYDFNMTPGKIYINSQNYTQVNIAIDTEDTNNVTGFYTSDIKFTSTNGCPNQTYNLTITAELTEDLNTTIETVLENVTGDTVIAPGQNMSIKVIPRYWNKSIVRALTNSDFTVSIKHKYFDDLDSALKERTFSSGLKVTENLDYYIVEATMPSDSLGGNYTVTVAVTDGLGNSDTVTYDYATIDGTALKLVSVDPSSVIIYFGNDSAPHRYNITNYGYIAANNVSVTFAPETHITVSPTMALFGNLAGNGGSAVNNTTVTAGTTVANPRLIASGNESSGTAKWDKQTDTVYYSVTAPLTPDSSPDNSGSGGSGDESGGSFTHKMEVIAPSSFDMDQGESIEKTVTVKNTGSFNENNVRVSVGGITSSWYSVSPSSENLITAFSKQFTVTINVPEDAEPISYTLTFTATSDDTSATGTTTMKVMPGEDMQEEIETNLTLYGEWYGDVLDLYNETKLSGGNVTDLDSSFNTITGLLIQAESYINLGDYFGAYGALKQVRELLMQAENDITGEKGKLEGEMLEKFMILGGIIVVIVIIAIAYFVSKSKRGYKFKPKFKRTKFRSGSGIKGTGARAGLAGKTKVAGTKLKLEEFKQKMREKKQNVKKKKFKLRKPHLRGEGE